MSVRASLGYGLRALRSRVTGRARLSTVSLYITNRCNLRCIYCSSPYLRTAELSLDQWRRVIRELSDLGCRRILILGGEPLVRKDVGAIIAAVKDHAMHCVLTSNGLLVPRYIDVLKALDTLVLSLDAIGEGNDRVRGAGVSDAVRSAIDCAQSAAIPVKLNAVISSETADGLDELIRFADRLDISLTVNVVRWGNPRLNHHADQVAQSDAATRKLLLKLADLSRSNPRILFSPRTYQFAANWPDYSRDRLEANDPLPLAPRCYAGRSYFSILPDGSTSPCAITTGEIVGDNAVSAGTEQGWRSLHNHSCKLCSSPCMLEQNYLHSLQPSVLSQFLRRHFNRYA